MKTRVQEFKALHFQEKPLMIGNIWNTQSALVFQKAGFQAVATSSAAVAATMGYGDGEQMSFKEYLFIIERIAKRINIPLSVDLEGGYGNSSEEIAENIDSLISMGVAGINIEDSSLKSGTRKLLSGDEFGESIVAIRGLLKQRGLEIFINVRCDVFLLQKEGVLEEALKRVAIYSQAGGDGLFFPGMTDLDSMKVICSASQLPVNAMCLPTLPSFDQLQKVGIRRISMGDFVNLKLYSDLEHKIQTLLNDGNFGSLFR